MSSSFGSLDHHCEAHSSCRANSHQSKLPAASTELIEQCRGDAGTGRSEWVTDGNGSAHNVELCAIDFADGLGKSGALSPVLRFESLEIGQPLCGKGLVHLYEIDVLQCQSGPFQCYGRRQYGRLQQLLARIERCISI